MMSFPTSEAQVSPTSNEGSKKLRSALRDRYVGLCDQRNLEPSRKVLSWIAHGTIDEPTITGVDSGLSIVKKLNPTTGTLIEADPIDPVIEIFRLIPLVHVSLDGSALHSTQIRKLFVSLLSETSRSTWTLSSLLLYGNQVDASVFPDLLLVLERFPLLTVVRVDPSPHCHLAQLDQLCAANEAKCRHSFVQRKRGDVAAHALVSAASSVNSADGASALVPKFFNASGSSWTSSENAAHTQKLHHQPSDVVPPLSERSLASSTSVPVAAAAASSCDSPAFPVSVSSFIGAMKSWVHFFYPAGKDLPDAMCYFLMKHTLLSLRNTQTNSMEALMEGIKQVERDFVNWRSGVFKFPSHLDDQELNIHSESNRCAHCDAILEPSSNGQVDIVCITQTKKLIDTLLMECEVGSKCFVQDDSHYVERLFTHLMSRFSESPSIAAVPYGDDESARYASPPQFCSPSCTKRFCRSILCAASGVHHAVAPIPFIAGVPVARQFPGVVEYDTLLHASSSMYFSADGHSSFSAALENPVQLYATYAAERHAAPRKNFLSVPSPAANSNRRGPLNDSTTAALKDVINDHVPQAVLLETELLASDPFFTCHQRFPTKGLCLADLFSFSRRGVPMVPRNLDLSTTDGDKHAHPSAVNLSYSLALKLSWSTNEPTAPKQFDIIRDYFLRGKKRLNGSNVTLGVKLRPALFYQLLSNASSAAGGVLASENEEGQNKFGIPVALHVTGVELVGNVWYALAEMHGRKIFLDEYCVNKGASHYGAFAFVEPNFEVWLLAVQLSDPHSPLLDRAAIKSLEPLERRVEMELALMLMGHVDSFYSSTISYAHRSFFSLPPALAKQVSYIRELLGESRFAPLECRVDSDMLQQVVSWYRAGNLGRLAIYWESEAPPEFHSFAIRVCRHLFAQQPQSVHPCLHAYVAGNATSRQPQHQQLVSAKACDIWFIPQSGQQRLYTSGRFPRLSTATSHVSDSSVDVVKSQVYHNILGEFGNLVDLTYVQHASSTASLVGAGHKRYVTMELTQRALRLTQLEFTIHGCEQSTAVSKSDQAGLRVTVLFSDDGKTFQRCASASLSSATPESSYSVTWRNVGAHRWWCVAVDPINHTGEVLHDVGGVSVTATGSDDRNPSLWIPLIDRISWKYKPDTVTPLIVNYSQEHFFVVHRSDPHTALLVDRPHLTTFASTGVGGADFALPRLTPCWSTNVIGPETGGGYLAGATSQLCEIPDKAIAYGTKLYCFSGSFVVVVDKFSGQVVSSASPISLDPLCSYFPRMFQEQLLGGFECFTNVSQSTSTTSTPLLFLYNATHFSLFCPISCSTIQQPTEWRCISGRSLVEVDEYGVASNSQLVTNGIDPYQSSPFPFAEVDVCLPIGRPMSNISKEIFAVCFESQYIRWEIADPRHVVASDTAAPVKLWGVNFKLPANATTNPLLPLAQSLPMLISSAQTKMVMDNILARSQKQNLLQEAYFVTPTSVSISRHSASNAELISGLRLEALLSRKALSRPTASNTDPSQMEAKAIHLIHIVLDAAVSLEGVVVIANAGGSTFTLLGRQHKSDPWQSLLERFQDQDGAVALWLEGNFSPCSEWGVRVSGPGITVELLSLSIFGKRGSVPSRIQPASNAHESHISPFLEWDIRTPLSLPPTTKSLQHIDCIAVVNPTCSAASAQTAAPPVIAGVALRWIDLFTGDGRSSGAPVRIRISSSSSPSSVEFGNQSDNHILVDAYDVQISDVFCIIPFRPRAIHHLTIERLHSDKHNVETNFACNCYLLEVPMRAERVSIVAKSTDLPEDNAGGGSVDSRALPLHLRVDPAAFALKLVERQVAAQTSPLPTALTSKVAHTLSRSGSEYHLSLAQDSFEPAKLLSRISTRVSTPPPDGRTASASVVAGRAVLSYRDLSNNWIVCTETFISEHCLLDFVWDSVVPSPPPLHWKIEFVHARVAVKFVDLHFLNSTTVTFADGFETNKHWSRFASTSSSQYKSDLDLTATGALVYSGPPHKTSSITLSIPCTAPFIGGIRIDLQSTHPSPEDVRILAVDACTGQRQLLWTGKPQASSINAAWPPTRCSDIVILNLRSNVGSCTLLLPESSAAPPIPIQFPPSRGASWSLHHGVVDVAIPSLPAVVPIAVGTTITLHGSSDHPQLLAALRLKASESSLQFHVSYLSDDGVTFTSASAGWLESTLDQWSLVRFAPYAALPTQWRLTCCACGARSDAMATIPAYVTIDIETVLGASVHQTVPVDLADVSCTFLTNAIARHNATSQAALRQRFLGKTHSTEPTPLQPYLRLGNFDSGVDGGDDWEKRSQVSTSSGGGLSSAPFIFVSVDLRSQPRCFSALEMNVQTDTEFELEVQWSDDNVTFQTVQVHRQGNGRWNSSWPSRGAHSFWRVVVSFAQLSGKSKKRSQASNIGADVDEKMLLPFIRAVTQCSVERIVWSEIDVLPAANRSVAVPSEQLIALRRCQVSTPRVLSGLNPLQLTSVPLGLRPPTRLRGSVFCLEEDIDRQDFDAKAVGAMLPSIHALWRAAVAKPSQSTNRVAIAAEDQLQSALPQIFNPQTVLDKEIAAQISKIFFGGVDFELTDASLARQTNRVTSDPSVAIRGTTVTGVRGIPPGTRLTLCFEWTNTSLIPSQPQIFVRSFMTVDRTWIAVQSEIPAFDSFGRFLPSIRENVFSDLSTYAVIYIITRDDIHVGGHFPPLVSLESQSFETLLSHGVNVLAPNVKAVSVVELFRGMGAPLQRLADFVEIVLGGSTCNVTLHTDFENGMGVRLIISAQRTQKLDDEGVLQPRSLSFIVTWDGHTSLTIDVVCEILLPAWAADSSFIMHGTLYKGNLASDIAEYVDLTSQVFPMALTSNDELHLTQTLFGGASPPTIGLRSVSGFANLRLTSARHSAASPQLLLENFSFHAVLRFSNALQIPCVLWPQRNSAATVILQTTNVTIPQLVLREFIHSEFNRVGSGTEESFAGVPVWLGDFSGVGYATLSLQNSAPILEFAGAASWRGSLPLPANMKFYLTAEGPLISVHVSVPPSFDCSWHDNLALHVSKGRLTIHVSLPRLESGVNSQCLVEGSFSSSRSSIPNSFDVVRIGASIINSVASADVDVEVRVSGRTVALHGHAVLNGVFLNWSRECLTLLRSVVGDAVAARMPQYLVGLDDVTPMLRHTDVERVSWKIDGHCCGTPFMFVLCGHSDVSSFDVVEEICAAILRHTALKTLARPVQKTRR